jgi:hypothetical protein
MSDSNECIVDLVALGASKNQSVGHRIDRRVEVLRDWLRNGIPAGKTIPSSLTGARQWEDLDLEIAPIVSPNEFTTTHPVFGSKVRDIAGLLTELKRKFGRPAKSSKKSGDGSAQFDRHEYDRSLNKAASQWHSYRDQLLGEKKRADAAEARCSLLDEESAEKDRTIAELRRKLAAYGGPKVVK